MLKLFERSMALQVVLVLLAWGLLWVRPLIAPPPMFEGDAVLYALLYSWVSPLPRLAVILAMVLVLVEGFGLNIVLSERGLVSQNSLLPTLLYVLFASSTTHTLTPMLLVAGVMIICTSQLMLRGTLLTIDVKHICTVTSLIGICTMFYVPSVLLMVSYLLIAISYRLYNFNDIVVMLLGFLSPYIILLSVLFMVDGIVPWWESLAETLGNPILSNPLPEFSSQSTTTIAGIAALVLVAVVMFFSIFGQMGDKTIVWKMNAGTVLLLLVGGIAMLLYSGVTPPDMTVVAIPIALCGSQMLLGKSHMGMGQRKKRTWHKDLILVITIVAAVLC